MSYENAPSTKMLATHCFMCNRPLRDSLSVEVGIGPVCREKSGYDSVRCNPEQRKIANSLIHKVSLNQGDGEMIKSCCEDLINIGFSGVASIVAQRLGIVVEEKGDRVVVKTPFSWAWVQVARTVPGRRYNGTEKNDNFPVEQKVAVYNALIKVFKGCVGFGPKGIFVVGQEKK